MIRTRSLHWAYPDGPPLDFPDLDLEQGGALLLQGRSGSGKSTWLALVAGLRTGGGELEVAGQPLALLTPAERDAWRGRTIGFLPQRLHLSESLTVAQNLKLAYFAAGVPAREGDIGAALGSLDVSTLADRRPSQLSGGQAQRVALARAVLMKPRVILADEPTASLDDEACADALALLRTTAAQGGATLVVATHDRRVREVWPDAPVLHLAAPTA